MKALGSSSSQHYQPVADGFLEFMPIHLISALGIRARSPVWLGPQKQQVCFTTCFAQLEIGSRSGEAG